ncbi:FlgD immunoglobulin-like domain containing protein [Gracilimonas sp.]|uniref:FlgD immunoglobulin-like domain containing protein n=1 Tax=Gracilimonas sp. TaxID=1974203 RepID=UPI0028723447|nr:FlgD immunoglobulin-like domain containing protein [Gracilimonas sp.]
MKKLFTAVLFLAVSNLGYSQVIGPIDDQFNSIRQNGVSSIAAIGDTVWISPSLNRNINNGMEWYYPENADSVYNDKGRVFSLALAPDTVIAGLGFSSDSPDGSVPAGYGFYKSIDGGSTWKFEDFPFDNPPSEECQNSSSGYDPDCDIKFTYGGIQYNRVRNNVAQQSPPYATDISGNVILSSVWASGLIRSTNFGETWERVILPPSNVSEMTPDNQYQWIVTINGENYNRYDPRQDNNLLGFGVLIDSQNRVWYGSAAGINISENALTAPIDSISWKHIRFDNSPDGLLADWIIAIEEEPGTGRIWMTNWITTQPQRQGLVYTDDGGETFTQTLIGERINDIGFKDGYIFAAGDNGLFISDDEGKTWIKSPTVKSPNAFIKPSAEFYSVATTTDRVWIGTEDGIASTDDYGKTWEITRVNFPLKGGNIHEPDARNASSYAYPNPFSPTQHELVRIKFEVKNQGNVNVRIFDFGMNLVREIENSSYPSGTYEAVWDGYDGNGRKVANGPYIYVIESNGKKVNGKILVAD